MNISRRKATRAPAATQAPLSSAVSIETQSVSPSTDCDLLVARAADWLAVCEHHTEMQLLWQRCETALFAKARSMKMSCEVACKSDLPEARRLRELGADIERKQRLLDSTSGEILGIPATTIPGAIAKVELGLRVQGRFDWRDHALELVEDGMAELRVLLSHTSDQGPSE